MDIKYNIYKALAPIVGPLAMRYWCHWSNRHFKNTIRLDQTLLQPEDRVTGITTLNRVLSKLYRTFRYTKDGVDQLYDAITPPPQLYVNYMQGEVKEDCDGFHSLLHYVLSMSNIECYLLTVNAYRAGHCVLICKLKDQWHVVDYRKVYAAFDTMEEAVADYNDLFLINNNVDDYEVSFNGLVDYNYETGKFYYIKAISPPQENKDKIGISNEN